MRDRNFENQLIEAKNLAYEAVKYYKSQSQQFNNDRQEEFNLFRSLLDEKLKSDNIAELISFTKAIHNSTVEKLFFDTKLQNFKNFLNREYISDAFLAKAGLGLCN
jgi:hypothetical protein